MWIHLTPKSGNTKVGPIPVTTTEEKSCPPECSLKGNDCYARFGPLGIHWKQVSKRSREDNWTNFCNRVRKFAAYQLWRHNQAGDLPQRQDGRLHKSKCMQLSRAAKHTRGWTYTHYDPTNTHNAEVISAMNSVNGLTVNLSADNVRMADKYYKLGIGPVTTVLPQDAPHRGNKTPNGLPIVVCPAQTQDDISCAQCKLCQIKNRKTIVGFLAHGIAKNRLSKKVQND